MKREQSPGKVAAALVAASLAFSSTAGAQQRVYIGNDDHTDYFWTGTDVTYRAAFIAMLNYYLDQAESTAGNPVDFRGRFTCDNSLWVWEYEHNQPAASFDRLIRHIRAGDITMSMQPLVPLYGAMPTESALRGLYYAGRLERRYGLDFNIVQAMENMTLPAGVASLWAGAGARYSWRGVCGCASQTTGGVRQREVYNFVGPDGRGVLMKWNTSNGDDSIGGYAEARRPTEAVNYMTGDSGFRSRWPYQAMAAFGYGHDDLQTTTDIMIRTAQAMSTPTRRVIVSNETDFFEDFSRNYGATVPTFTGSFGNEWDLLTASLADVTARMRRSVEKLRTAEALATVVALRDPTVLAGRAAARDEAFMRLGTFYDHDWTADTPIGRAPREGFQRASVALVEAYVNSLHDDALARLATMIAAPATPAARYVVFNPLGWQRTDSIDLPATATAPFHVVDLASGADVPSQLVNDGVSTHVRLLARDVPGIGYRVFEVRAGAGAAFPAIATATATTLDNGRYRVIVASDGAITSLLDHGAADRDLVRAGLALNRQTGAAAGTAVVESTGPVSATVRVTAGGAPAHTTRVTVYSGVDRVDLENRITQNFGSTIGYQFDLREAGYTIRHEEIGMIARVARVSAGGDYSDRNARTDYQSFNHFVDLSEAGYGVTLSNGDSSFMRVSRSTVDTLDTSTPSIFAVAGMQVDGVDLGFANQGGDHAFLNRYAIIGHGAYDPASAMRVSLEHQNPLVARALAPSSTASLPLRFGLLSVDSPDVLPWAVKPAEEGVDQGVIVRLWNLAESARTFQLSAPGSTLRSAGRATHIETDTGAVALTSGRLGDHLDRQQLQTWRLMLDGLVTSPTSPDAGVADVPVIDVPRDTGTPDTGTPDTGTPDTGPRDTGVTDTGARDVGTIIMDAASDVRDAGVTPDRSPVDTGTIPPMDAGSDAVTPMDATTTPDDLATGDDVTTPDDLATGDDVATPDDLAQTDDAARVRDTGTTARDVVVAGDSKPIADAATTPPTGTDDGGCGCRVGDAPRPGAPSRTLAAAFMAFAVLRRRRRVHGLARG